MPVLRRRSRNRREDFTELTNEQRRHLTSGHTFFRKGYPDREAFELGWQLHGEQILADFIATFPGRRPFGWYLCEHGKERPVLAPKEESRVRRIDAAMRPDRFGFLSTSLTGFGGWFQEPEESYLRRNGLLTDNETEAMACHR